MQWKKEKEKENNTSLLNIVPQCPFSTGSKRHSQAFRIFHNIICLTLLYLPVKHVFKTQQMNHCSSK